MSTTIGVIDQHGQIALPDEVLLAHGLKKGDQVEFVTEGGATLIRPLQQRLRGFHRDVGRYPLPESEGSVEGWLTELRGGEFEEDPSE